MALEPLNLKLTGSADGLSAALGKAESKVGMFGGAIGSISTKFTGLVAAFNPVTAAIAAGLAVVTAGAAAAAMAVSKIGGQFKPIDDLADAANRLGVSFNELKGLRLAIGEATGLQGEQVDSAIAKFQLNLSEAASKQAGAAFERLRALGLDANQLIAQGPTAAIEAIATKVAELKSPTDQLRVAFDLFGRSGVGFVNALREGPEAIRETVEWAEKALGLTEQQVAAVGRMNDSWDRIGALVDTFWQVLASEAAPAIEAILLQIIEWVDQLGGVQAAAQRIVDTLVKIAGTQIDVARIFIGDFNFDEVEKLEAAVAKIRSAPVQPRLTASESQLSMLEQEAETAKALEKQAEEWGKKAEKFRQQLQSPAERLQAGILDLQNAVTRGGLDWETYARGVKSVTDEFVKARESTSPKPILAAVTDRAEQIRVVAERENAKQDKAFQDKLLAETKEMVKQITQLVTVTKEQGREPPPIDLD